MENQIVTPRETATKTPSEIPGRLGDEAYNTLVKGGFGCAIGGKYIIIPPEHFPPENRVIIYRSIEIPGTYLH